MFEVPLTLSGNNTFAGSRHYSSRCCLGGRGRGTSDKRGVVLGSSRTGHVQWGQVKGRGFLLVGFLASTSTKRQAPLEARLLTLHGGRGGGVWTGLTFDLVLMQKRPHAVERRFPGEWHPTPSIPITTTTFLLVERIKGELIFPTHS